MIKQRDLAERLKISRQAVVYRAKKLGLTPRYEKENDQRSHERVYTDDEAALIADGREFKRTGRPTGTGKYRPAEDGGE